MNKKQLIAMWVAIVIVVLMCAFPPYLLHYSTGSIRFVGYRFIGSKKPRNCHISTLQLAVQLLAVATVATGAIVTLKTKQR